MKGRNESRLLLMLEIETPSTNPIERKDGQGRTFVIIHLERKQGNEINNYTVHENLDKEIQLSYSFNIR